MKVAPAQRKLLRTIIAANTGRGMRGVHPDRHKRFSRNNLRVLTQKRLVEFVELIVGRGGETTRRYLRPTQAGRRRVA